MGLDSEFIDCLNDIISPLEELKIPYFVGGSVASGVRGIFRATNDIDIVCKFTPENLNAFIDRCKGKYFVDDVQAHHALRDGGSFNIIHIVACVKIDIFTKLGEFQEQQLKRATPVGIYEGRIKARVASSEDIILAKLNWFKMGNCVSDRQWSDICGIIKVQGERLDESYLQEWASKLNLSDLLDKAITQGKRLAVVDF